MENQDQFIVEPPSNEPDSSTDSDKTEPKKESSSKAGRSKAAEFGHFAFELLRTAIIVSAIAYGIRLFVLQPFVVEGSSMFPRFHTNDFLIVDKMSYRFGEPKRGDIIVFKYPGTENSTEQINYVKRIIGIPGETVQIEGGKVKIINDAHPEGVVLDEPYISADNLTALPAGSKNNSFVVSPDTFFVLGDNRKASNDSREWGLLPAGNVIGRVVVQALPLDRASFVSHARYTAL